MTSPGAAHPPMPWARRGRPANGLATRRADSSPRRRRPETGSSTAPAFDSRQEFHTADHRLAFQLHHTREGTVVHRCERIDGQGQCEECLLLTTAEDYRRWVEDDPVKFLDPVVYNALQRLGHGFPEP